MAQQRPARRGGRRRVRKNIPVGVAHIKSSFNNTIVTLTDREGNVIAWESAGGAGFKGSRKSTPFAAQMAAENAARKAQEHGVKTLVNAQANVADIQALKPDAVVLATGSRMRATALAAGSQPSIDARDWLAANQSAPVGEKLAGTAVLFDQDHGAGTYALADLLAKRYSKLVVLTPRTQLGRAIAYVNLIGVYRRLHQARAEIVGAALPQRWTSRQLTYVNAFNGDETVIDHVDLFLHATPREAQDELAAGLRSQGLEVHVVGDAYAPRTLLAAIHEGHRAGLNV